MSNLTYEEFKKLSRIEHDEFISKAVQCINQNEYCFLTAQVLVEAAEKNGMFDKTKHGFDVPEIDDQPIPDMIGLTPIS